ncbi:relaxase/mobilization nuclease domain-containing protein [Streptomyces antarcticus]|uniref:relaxase/mobilization nuclease domain-containing protein n=1 Tax=Streptomyces antarcticus TaxID=2996458 RepID=UPI00226F6316|nr:MULTISPECIES: relaxase/mobilization nuclease domain-containing protein [unclassified Streptomyces]MCY0943619.1 relaxase/mobilization nuclease domain-containing protein [Streptomyces sp. H34-AA3]MCZ4086033.1 relaxase/mobilization nuclease domain-containing protein [Streptomyces sp. H34-S5]
MIAKIGKAGADTRGVLRYLYGPGHANEHTNPHLVASWDDFAPDPGRDETATLTQLATALDLRVKQAGDRAPDQHVWHCSVRSAPEDRTLSDGEWAAIARRVLNATGIAPAGDPDACRWVAVRHADDHIHIVATKVRGDLTPPRNWNDYLRADKECAAIEKEYGLRQVVRGDRTAAKRPSRAEQEKARRTGSATTPRERLRTTVRTALAAATSTEEFFTILRGTNVLVDIQHFPSGDIRGYKVALPDDTNAKGEPVWFSGSTLSPDLSYPKISERLAPTESAPVGQHSGRRRTAWQQVADAAAQIPDVLAQADDAVGQARITVLAESLDALLLIAPSSYRPQLAQAAAAFERANRSRIRARHQQAQTTRRAIKAIVREPAPKDGALLAILLDTLLLAVVAAQHWHQTRDHDQQAEAARQAAEHLRAAYQAAAVQPLTVIHQRGLRLTVTVQQQQAALVRRALPDLAEQILTEPGWPALAATLTDTQAAGHDPAGLLTQAVRHRELVTATSLSDVLTWRLHRLAGLNPEPTPRAVGTTTPSRATGPATHANRPRRTR